MNIGGLQKNSLIDYPGKLSSVIFFSGCNFDCPYCHNPDLAGKNAACPNDLTSDEVYNFLRQRRDFLDGVVLSGGEPTLQPDLVQLCNQMKEFGFPVKLDTNGSRPRVIQRLIECNLVDYVAMDLKTDPVLYKSFIKPNCDPGSIFTSIEIIMRSGVNYEFRTTCVKPIVTPQTIENIARLIQGAKLHVLQRFRNNRVLHPEFFIDNDHEYSNAELGQLQEIARPWVGNCIIR
jgi:pyruvate formate lyase activating enzyme